ncbi:MAG: hypothetical protein A2V88_11660 [Elusimicrobia bacterium RBG_16_66_12]|nr:MAG: hypothetical protein A2V88_11660 [Elusimicrobia bacterium RBG_16_66_12]
MAIQSSGDYEERGLRLLHAGRAEEALTVFEEGERRFPGDAELLMGTAMARLRMGDFAVSCGILEGLRKTRPTAEGLQALSEAYLERGMLRQALDVAVEAAKGAGPDAGFLYRLGRAFYSRHLYGEAFPFYEKAAEVAPSWAEAWFGFGACQWALKRTAGAEAALRRAVELDPEDWQAKQFLGCVLCDVGRKEEAKALLESIPLEAPWQKPALERLVAMSWWPTDAKRRGALEVVWREVMGGAPPTAALDMLEEVSRKMES